MSIFFQYASFRPQLQPIDFDVELLNGGDLTQSGTINLSIQLVNRVGKNLLSVAKTVNYSSGKKIRITINQSAINSGEEVFEIVLSGRTTNNPQDNKQLAIWKARESNQISLRNLPASIELSKDEHIRLAASVSGFANLPTDKINGTIRYVADEDKYYQFSSEASNWIENTQGDSCFVDNTFNHCDRALDLVETSLPAPPKQPSIDSTPIRYWIFNNLPEGDGDAIPAGTSFGLDIYVNGVNTDAKNRNYSLRFSDAIKIVFIGIVRKSTGIINTNIEGVGEIFYWNQAKNLIELKADLLPGYAAVYDIYLSDKADFIIDFLPPNPSIEIKLYHLGTVGIVSDLYNLIGNAALFDSDILRVVPSKLLKGKGTVENYSFTLYSPRPLIGVQPETEEQFVLINGALGGICRLVNSLVSKLDSEAIRAIISTRSGYCNPSSYSNYVQLLGGENLELTLNLPVEANLNARIRSDYPDEAIANYTNCNWQPPKLRIYIDKDGVLYQKNDLINASSSPTQTIVISNLAGFTPNVPGIPLQTDNYFGLFGYGSLNLNVTGAVGGGSSLLAGQYRAIVRYEYPAPNSSITKISHSDPRVEIKEFLYPLADLINSALLIISTVNGNMPTRKHLRFVGSSLNVSDDASGDATVISLQSPSTIIPTFIIDSNGDLLLSSDGEILLSTTHR